MFIEFATENAAFEDNQAAETARILRAIADKVENGEEGGAVKDLNGNTIGRWYA